MERDVVLEEDEKYCIICGSKEGLRCADYDAQFDIYVYLCEEHDLGRPDEI